MSHAIPVPDELYEKIASYAAERRQPIEDLIAACLAAGVEQLATASDSYVYNLAEDPIAQFIGAFDSGNQPPLEPHEHDLYFAGEVTTDDAAK